MSIIYENVMCIECMLIITGHWSINGGPIVNIYKLVAPLHTLPHLNDVLVYDDYYDAKQFKTRIYKTPGRHGLDKINYYSGTIKF